ncbi:Calpain catalytic domain-containing protein [Mycena sanguinolenta]|uniref:Calpain catalytic domain-containing protein n=1 Tax=Mycena sanguinolenta TaxID=230812 RepID=A0A8H6ZHX5_9AGAR|nr:Calpain catalytic domain-containing protein [Mycena sanguinolenta]
MFSPRCLFLFLTMIVFSMWSIVVHADQVPLSLSGGHGDSPPVDCLAINSPAGWSEDTEDEGLLFGTNANAWGDESVSAYDFATLDFDLAPKRSDRLNFHSQPALPVLANCAFHYQHRLGANGTHRYGNLRGDDDIVSAKDVHQGGLGDCAIGGAILALIARKQDAAFRAVLTVNKDLTLTARFKRAGVKTPYLVNMDDSLPVRNGAKGLLPQKKPCGYAFGGYLPTLSTTDRCDNYRHQVPFLEKALAKYLDAFPAYSGSPQKVGYAGLRGISSATVMEAITGGRPYRLRAHKGDQRWRLERISQTVHYGNTSCLHCVNAHTALEGRRKATLEPLKTTHSFEITDAHGHKYVIAAWHDFGIVGGNSKAQTVLLANPWGCNPDRNSSNGCGFDEEGNKLPATLSIPLDVLAAFISAIHSVTLSR